MIQKRYRGETAVALFVRKALRKLRARLESWTPEKDREYHDTLFQAQDFDAFTFSYPGYITIRRFADLASPYLKDLKFVLDLGCGPGEITCELARRHPDIAFFGVDHSLAGIERANSHARSLGLQNISFLAADMETYAPGQIVNLVTMFDAFHHLASPEEFIKHAESFSPRFLLVEPRGDWKGRWRKDLDFDWLALEMDKIRARIAYAVGEPEPPRSAPIVHPSEMKGAAFEQRYTLADFQRMFKDFGLRIRGTVSGLETYPPGPSLSSPSRERFGKMIYDLYAEVDEILRDRKLDLLAKHWVVYAEKGLPEEEIEIPGQIPEALKFPIIQGPYDVDYLEYDGPLETAGGEEFRARVRLRNRSFRPWTSRDPQHPDYLSYHWLDNHGSIVVWDGERSSLPRDLGPGDEADVLVRIKAPDKSGRYVLELDLVQEKKTWFSEAGIPGFPLPFRVKKK